MLYAVATRIDFLTRGVVQGTSSEKTGQNAHAHSVRFLQMRSSASQPKDAHQNLGRGNQTRLISGCPHKMSALMLLDPNHFPSINGVE